jgi:hypothetical protein
MAEEVEEDDNEVVLARWFREKRKADLIASICRRSVEVAFIFGYDTPLKWWSAIHHANGFTRRAEWFALHVWYSHDDQGGLDDQGKRTQ